MLGPPAWPIADSAMDRSSRKHYLANQKADITRRYPHLGPS